VARNTPDGQPRVEKQYSIADIWINPKAILYLQADDTLMTENRESPLLEDLSPEHSFTKLFISENGFARQLTVLGEPSSISKQIEGLVLRG
jgi:hypothetical protein